MKSIYEFKQGDEIVRVEAAKPLGNFLGGKPLRDRSYMGEKMIFHGIANGVIYLKPTEKISLWLADDKFISLRLDVWDEGWNYWIDPKTITKNHIPKYLIKEKLEEALNEENYELANDLKKLLNHD